MKFFKCLLPISVAMLSRTEENFALFACNLFEIWISIPLSLYIYISQSARCSDVTHAHISFVLLEVSSKMFSTGFYSS